MDFLKKYWLIIAIIILVLIWVFGSASGDSAKRKADASFCDDVDNYRKTHGAYDPTTIDWGDIASGIRDQGFDYGTELRYILAFIKGYDLAIKGWTIGTFKNEITTYLKSDYKVDWDRVKIGEYCTQ